MDTALTHENLSNQLNTIFNVKHENGDLQLELLEVSEPKRTDRQEQFSIVFRGPADRLLGQGMRQMEHPQFGEFDLFIVPIRPEGEGLYYEAIFNRFLDSSSNT